MIQIALHSMNSFNLDHRSMLACLFNRQAFEDVPLTRYTSLVERALSGCSDSLLVNYAIIIRHKVIIFRQPQSNLIFKLSYLPISYYSLASSQLHLSLSRANEFIKLTRYFFPYLNSYNKIVFIRNLNYLSLYNLI